MGSLQPGKSLVCVPDGTLIPKKQKPAETRAGFFSVNINLAELARRGKIREGNLSAKLNMEKYPNE